MVADLASHCGYVVNTKWDLSNQMFPMIQNQYPWGPTAIDLFTNSLNHRLVLYISPCPDPAAMSVNALVVGWPRKAVLYAFPPTTIIDRVLHKIVRERPTCLLIAPRLLEAPWYLLLQQLLAQRRFCFPFRSEVYTSFTGTTRICFRVFNLHLWCINFPPWER